MKSHQWTSVNLFTLSGVVSALLLASASGALASDSSSNERFRRACDRGEQLTIAAVGDVLLHGSLQARIQNSGYSRVWSRAVPYLERADLAYANLEGPTAEGITADGRSKKTDKIYDNSVYTGYPLFNYNPKLIPALKQAGFDVVSTANNHSLDRREPGVDKSIEALRKYGMPFAGTRTRAESQKQTSTTWHTFTRTKGWNIAWIACSFSTNGIPDRMHLVLDCFKDAGLVVKAIQTLSKAPGVDAVIVTPHWGNEEYTHKIEKSQAQLAQRFVDAGASAILGNHPHVVKPWVILSSREGKEVPVVYSIGNFVSAQNGLAKQTSAIFYLGLTRRPGEKAFVNGLRYIPTYMNRSSLQLEVGDGIPGESRQLAARILGTGRRLSTNERLVTNPECQR